MSSAKETFFSEVGVWVSSGAGVRQIALRSMSSHVRSISCSATQAHVDSVPHCVIPLAASKPRTKWAMKCPSAAKSSARERGSMLFAMNGVHGNVRPPASKLLNHSTTALGTPSLAHASFMRLGVMESKAFLKSQSVHMCCALFRLADSEAASTRKMAVSVQFLQRYPCWNGCRTCCSSLLTIKVSYERLFLSLFSAIF